ncbi:unnamed protein product [Haemonchus placei]|uniref:Uncharacterized protein n=1 Tax=Haemonchus placei TaxID=6290 RepID=A0A0N4WHV6_HAEPC|nr:unnamed protein product [Haemonchus placei]
MRASCIRCEDAKGIVHKLFQLIACSITNSWPAPELSVTGSLYCKGKPIVHTRVALLDGTKRFFL